MRQITRLEDAGPECDVCLTIGAFDGVHRGHQELVRTLVVAARDSGRLSAVLTFHPHPRAVLQPEQAPAYLSSPAERAAMLAELGLDLLVVLPFDRALADTPAEDFVALLHRTLRMRALYVGPGYALGKGRGGDVPTLRALGERLGYDLHVVEPVCYLGAPISSTRIRSALQAGRVEEAAELLGRPYSLASEVVPGARRGRALGFRTANLRPEAERALPVDGVYAVWAVLEGKRLAAVANVGVRPSFGGGERLVEAHLLDFEGDLYARCLRLEFVDWLRPELRFADREALVAQVRADVAATRELLGVPEVSE